MRLLPSLFLLLAPAFLAAPLRAQFTFSINGQSIDPDAVPKGPSVTTVAISPETPKPGQPYRIVLRVTNPPRIRGEEMPQLTGPDGSKLVNTGRNSTYSIVNGVAQSSLVLTYTGNAPEKPGTYRIPAQSPALGIGKIDVPETAFVVRELRPGENAYRPATIALEIDPGTHYVGQDFDARLIVTGSGDESPAAITSLNLGDDALRVARVGRSTIARDGDVSRQTIPLRITPLASGAKSLVVTANATFLDADGFPADQRPLSSKPVALRVEHTPEAGKPESYRGAVGDFTLDTPAVEPVRGKAGEPMTLTFIIAGDGSPDRIPPPALNGKNWSVREDEPVTGVDQKNRPARQYRYTITPLYGGRQKTPTGEISWFDPKAGRYVTATVTPLDVDVEGPPPPKDAEPLTTTREPAKLAPDPAPTGREVSWETAGEASEFWILQAALGAALATGAFVTARKRRFAAHPEILVRRRARSALHRESRGAFRRLAAGDLAGYARHARAALRAGVAPALDARPDALTGDETLAAIPDASLREKLRPLFDAEDAERFAGGVPTETVAATAPALRAVIEILLRSLR